MLNSVDKDRLAASKHCKSLQLRPGALGLLGLIFALSGCAPEAVYYPQPGMAIWANGKGGAIEGSATLRSGVSGYARTCASFDAYIFPVTPQTTAFIQERFSHARNGSAPSLSLRDGLGTFVTSNGGGRVACRNDGTFTFSNLADGSYYVLADIKWLLRWAHEGGTVSTVADVHPRLSTSVAIDVAIGTHGEISDVSR